MDIRYVGIAYWIKMDKSFIQVKDQSIGETLSHFTGEEGLSTSRRERARPIGDVGRSDVELHIVLIDL